MTRVKITVLRKADYQDLQRAYENPIERPCEVHEGDVFWATGEERPMGLCESAWETMLPFVRELLRGGGNFYDGWMKNPHSAMLSCNDGFRPVTFYLEVYPKEI